MLHGQMVVALLLNALLIALEVWAVKVRYGEVGIGMFRFYTLCSNALALCTAMVTLVCLLSMGSIPLPARLLKYVACCTQTITFLVVICVLTPLLNAAGQPGWHLMFMTSGRMVTHLLGPLLTVASWLLCETSLCEAQTMPGSWSIFVSLIPTLAYATVAYACNYLRLWDGPYPFLRVWNMPLWKTVTWFVVLLAAAIAIAVGLQFVEGQVMQLC